MTSTELVRPIGDRADRMDPEPTDWARAEDFLRRHPPRSGGSLSWVTARPLIAAVNHLFARGAGDLVPQLRRTWVATSADQSRAIDFPDADNFVITGDVGSQDPSQYVSSPELSRTVAHERAGFVMIISDVIYPAGHVDDYVDGLYAPYRSEDPAFHPAAPLLALPGNHDWYDGLFGFMHHFCGRDRLPDSAYAPEPIIGRAALSWRPWAERLCRVLWRRPPAPRPETTTRRDSTPPMQGGAQPGPYYTVRTPHLLIVAIDTGIDGTIDRDQWSWLVEVSRDPMPKLLVTGKPLVVNAEIKTCRVEGEPDGPTVWSLVTDPAHRYVGTVGGDVHNFQAYRVERPADGGPQIHLVCGGGGAYLHPTHPYALDQADSRLVDNDRRVPFRQPDLSFPTPRESLESFARLLIPSLIRLLRHVALLLLGAVGALAAPHLLLSGDALAGATALGWVAMVLLAVVIMVRYAIGGRRDGPVPHLALATGCVVGGVLIGSVVGRVDHEHLPVDVGFWFAFTAFMIMINVLVRRSGWWRPADEYSMNVKWPWFFGCLLGLAATSLWAQHWLTGGWLWPAVGSAWLVVVALTGWVLRHAARRGRRWWFRHGAQVGIGAEAVFGVLGVGELAARTGRLEILALAGLGAVLALPVLLLAAAVVLVTTTELATHLVRGVGRRDGAAAWGAVARRTHHLMMPLVGLALAGWLVVAHLHPVLRPAAITPTLAIVVVGWLLASDLIRIHVRSYRTVVPLLGSVGLIGLYAAPGWLPTALLAGLAVAAAVGCTALLSHLAFLKAYALLVCPAARRTPAFTDEDVAEIIAARQATPRRVPDLPPHVWLWTRLTAPGVGEPGGPLQAAVAEIFASDRPPFFKSFLGVRTTPTTATIVLHRVFGDRPATQQTVAVLDLTEH